MLERRRGLQRQSGHDGQSMRFAGEK